MELTNSLNKKFLEQYSKSLAELNKNIYPAAKLDSGNYEAPIISIGNGGGTVIENKEAKLGDPAPITVEMKEVKSFDIVYRLAIPIAEAEIADKNPAYFQYFFDKVLEKAIINYRTTVGGPDKLRFGSHYIKAEILDINGGADALELRIDGSWSTEIGA